MMSNGIDWSMVGAITAICSLTFGLFFTVIWFSIRKWMGGIEEFKKEIAGIIKEMHDLVDNIKIDLTQNYINYKKMEKHEEENEKKFDLLFEQSRKHTDDINNIKIDIARNIQLNSGLLEKILQKLP